MPQAFLQRQFSHPSFPELGRVCMTQGVWRDPWLTNTKPLAVPLEEFDEGMVAQRLSASLSCATNEKQVRALDLLGALRHDVIAHRLQRLRLMQVHHSFGPRFRADPFRMVRAIADRDPASGVGDVLKTKVENFAWPQSPLEQEEKHSLVPLETQGGQKLADLLIGHGTRHSLNRFDTDSPTDWSLPGGSSHEGVVAVGDACISGIVHFQDGIFLVRKLLGNDQELVKGGNSGKDAVDGRRRQPRRGTSLLSRAEDQGQPLSLSSAGKGEQVLQKLQRTSGSELLVGEVLFAEKGHEVQQVVGIRREGVRRIAACAKVSQKTRDDGNGLTALIDEFKERFVAFTEMGTLDSHDVHLLLCT